MEAAKRTRTVMRAAFTRALNDLAPKISEASTGAADLAELQVFLQVLEDKNKALEDADSVYIKCLIETENVTAETIDTEMASNDEYKRKYIRARMAAMTYLPIATSNAVSGHTNSAAGNTEPVGAQPVIKLPKIELRKFSGDVKEWLPFWSQFRKIHENANINKGDKFQYLLQAMTPQSRAAELVDSFPPVEENYDGAIASLKNRFGRDEVLVEVYVRELLKLVMQNVLKPNDRIPLSSLYDKIEAQLRSLESLGVTSDKCGAMLLPLVESSLPEELLRAWQRQAAPVVADGEQREERLSQLIKFLRSEVENEERISIAMHGFDLKNDEHKTSKHKQRTDQVKGTPSAISLHAQGKPSKPMDCVFCQKEHANAKCEKARKMSLDEKKSILQQKHACFNCLKIGHQSRMCRSNLRCAMCSKRHVLLMCPEIGSRGEVTVPINADEVKEKVLSNSNQTRETDVILQTLHAKIRNGPDERVVRVFFDQGSTRSYATKDIIRQMKYEPISEHRLKHSLFGNVTSAVKSHKKYVVHMCSLDNSYACNFKVFDEEEICAEISLWEKLPWMDELQEMGIQLTDGPTKCDYAAPIKILIGADIAGKLMTGRTRQLKSGLTAVETSLGWTLMGQVPKYARDGLAEQAISMYQREACVSDLWELDAIGISDPVVAKSRKDHDLEVLQRFRQTVTTNTEGRYEICLPWVETHPSLPNNRELAERRLIVTTAKLKSSALYDEYNRVFHDWLAEGIIEVVPSNELEREAHYLPHRGVVKMSSTTPLRPVFDASAKCKNFPSLNDCLEKGPNLIELVFTILLRFRAERIGIVADIKKAFLQISLNKEDRNFLRFLWYDELGKIIVYRHSRVVFGVSCSPFLLGAVINYHLMKLLADARSKAMFQNANKNLNKLMESLYVDNCVTSLSSTTEIEQFKYDARLAMSEGAFDLRGWENSHSKTGDVDITVLGLIWDKNDDTLRLTVPQAEKIMNERITKRSMLSYSHRIFDPLGFVCPVMIIPKLLLQQTWISKIKWDDEVCDEIQNEFKKWLSGLKTLSELRFPRWAFSSPDQDANVTFHVFCDASRKAYAAVIFARVEGASQINVSFVAAKARVAPVAPMTIPRLELLAACMGVRLACSTFDSLKMTDKKVTYWSDSGTVVFWIQRNCPWAPFVDNRVKEIRSMSCSKNWKHIPGELNPADLPSRGCTIDVLCKTNWWNGPEWLRKDESEWPISNVGYHEDEIKNEIRKTAKVTNQILDSEIVSTLSQMNSIEKIQPFYVPSVSNFRTVVRAIARIKRFVTNYKLYRAGNQDRLSGKLTSDEINKAEKTILSITQRESFHGIDDIQLRNMNVFVAEDGLIRMKSKILERDDNYSFRYPIVLLGENPLVRMIISEFHIRLGHVSVTALLSALREEYWIIHGRKVARSIVRKCVVCARQSAQRLTVDKTPLPMNRVRDARVFEIVGVDFAGPLYLRDEAKAWICIFTCAVYRAIHLELVSSLSTDKFIEAFRRFVARRGRPSTVYSDNGTNFEGFCNLLKRIDWVKIQESSLVTKVEWKFNPPSAPWWGGWWERLIRVLKRMLRKILGKTCLSYEEMLTVLCDCESVINARPLTYLSDDPRELAPITPNLFLQEIREVGLPDCDVIDREKLKKRFKYRQFLKEELRKRFRSEYLGQLKYASAKKLAEGRQIKLGDIVLIGNDCSKRLEWPLGRVIELLPGKDGIVRVVRLRTATGQLVRPVQRLYCLEVDVDMEPEELRKVYDKRVKSKTVIRHQSINELNQSPNNVELREENVPTVSYKTRSGRIVKPVKRF